MIRKAIRHVAKHRKQYYKDRLFRRVNERKLAEALEGLGVTEGKTLYLQSSFGSLGYYPNGMVRFIALLQRILGSTGTIVMPCFPFSGAMQDYVQDQPKYDARETVSKVGLLPEALRKLEGARRSCHPTHPVVALGDSADWIVADHELCTSPQGDNSPFDKLVPSGALVLRINTPAFPLCHRLQEIVGWPNLFIEEQATLECIDDAGREQKVTSQVYRKKIPFILYLPGAKENCPVATSIIDFPLLFEMREDEYRNQPERAAAHKLLLEYRQQLEADGIRKSCVVNGCPIDSFPADAAMQFAVDRVHALLNRYRSWYELDAISARN